MRALTLMSGSTGWAMIALALAGCGARSVPAPQLAAPALASMIVQPEPVPVERRLDGVIEAVNQGTVAAQTAGRVEAILYDVNDFVPAGAVIVRLRSTEQHASLAQAQAALSEATARAAEAQTRYQRIAEHVSAQGRAEGDARRGHGQSRCRCGAPERGASGASRAPHEGVAYTEVRAPYAGVVTHRLVQVGETRQPRNAADERPVAAVPAGDGGRPAIDRRSGAADQEGGRLHR